MRDSYNPMQDYTSVGSAEKLGFVGQSPIAEQGKPLRVMDECKEVSPEDIERVRVTMEQYPPDLPCMQSFIQTESSSDWGS